MGGKPTTFIYGEAQNGNIVDEAPLFFFKQTDPPKDPARKKNPSNFQLRPIADLNLLIHDEGVLAEHEDFDLTFTYVDKDGSYLEVFLHNALDDVDIAYDP